MRWLALALLIPTQALAGPWQRDEGAVFLSFGGNIAITEGAADPVSRDPALYLEWGATDRVTLTFSGHTTDQGRDMAATLAAQIALPIPERFGVASAALGFGVLRDGEEQIVGAPPVGPAYETALITGALAWGYDRPRGWHAVEMHYLHQTASGNAAAKVELTWGWHLSDRISAMVQLEAGQQPEDDPYAKLSSGLIYGITEGVRVNAGVQQGLTGDGGTGLNLGLWLEF